MTLVEVTVALALSGLLMAALVGVLRGTQIQLRAAQRLQTPVWSFQAIDLIQRDLIAAERLAWSHDTLWIQGTLPSYSPDGELKRRQVGYAIHSLPNGKSALVRIDSTGIEYMAIGPTRMLVERIDDDGILQPLPPTAGPVPAHVRIWIWGDTELPNLSQDLVLRARS